VEEGVPLLLLLLLLLLLPRGPFCMV